MTTAVQQNVFQQGFTRLGEWTKAHPKAALITSIACAALGIACIAIAATVVLVPAAALALACTAVGAFTISFALLHSYINSSSVKKEPKTPPTRIENPKAPAPRKRIDLVKVINETLQDLKNGYYMRADGVKVYLPWEVINAQYIVDAGMKAQRTANEKSRQGRPETFETRITVEPKDCLYAAKELIEEGLRPIVLDMANADDPGGGYLRGARSQEEEICRRSALSIAIDSAQGFQFQKFFPINPVQDSAAGILVPNIPVFRAGIDRKYEYLEEPFFVDIAVVAAPYRPALKNVDGHLRINDKDAALIRERIRTMLHMAHVKGNNAVVLGAFGCGAFGNPPGHIAEIFKEVIKEEFANCFEKIFFAILKDQNDGRAHNPEGNYVPFKKQFPD